MLKVLDVNVEVYGEPLGNFQEGNSSEEESPKGLEWQWSGRRELEKKLMKVTSLYVARQACRHVAKGSRTGEACFGGTQEVRVAGFRD